jgi:hypothetical protein
MHTIELEKELQASLLELWELVADFSNLSWFNPAEKVEKIGHGIGEIRRISMAGLPAPIEEQLLAIDHQQHTIEYKVLENAANIMQDYRVVASLKPAGEHKTIALWKGQFRAINGDIDPQLMIDMMTSTYSAMLEDMEKAATGQVNR